MEKWLDAAYAPTSAELVYFKSVGIAGVAGYFKYSSTDHVLNGWSDTDFQRVIAAGFKTMAYCSGYADPAWCSNRAASLGITICLDDEGGMRPDGSWVPGWLSTSGAGLYGNGPVHVHAAPFHILAAYPGHDPQAVWSTVYAPKPATPCGWQWQGTHNVDGLSVDSSWFDVAIGGVHGGSGQSIGGVNMYLEAPFQVASRATTRWYGTPGGQDMGSPGAQLLTVSAVSADGAYYQVKGTSWWVAASQVGVVIPAVPAPVPDVDITMDQVNAAIAAAVAKLPAPTGGVTLEQVQSVIAAEIAKLPAATVPTLWDVFKATFAAPK